MAATLFDYTTLVGAANVLACTGNDYPESVTNPYSLLVQGRKTPPDAPMWLEVAALADTIESIVIHDRLLVLDALADDRVFEEGRYGGSIGVLLNDLQAAGFVERVKPPKELAALSEEILEGLAKDRELLGNLVETYFSLLRQPVYSQLPNLFSHSQTVYKFDGETIWNRIERLIPLRKFTRDFQAAALRSGFRPDLRWTSHYYPEAILAFLVRGILYDTLAARLGCPYHPHAARAPVVLASGLALDGGVQNLAALALDFIGDTRDTIAAEVNRRLGGRVFDLAIPPIFASVLSRANSSKEIVSTALEMRRSRSATAFRSWLAQATGGDLGLDLVTFTSELSILAENLKKELGILEETVDVRIGVVTTKRRIPRWLHREIPWTAKPHVQFLRGLARDAMAAISLENHLIRVFATR